MKKLYPIAAIDVETAAFYRPEDLNKLQIEWLFAKGKLGYVISIGIVSIDKNMNIERERFTFKPSMKIDPRSTKVHGYGDEFFEENSDLYD